MNVDFGRLWGNVEFGEDEVLYVFFFMLVVTVSLAIVGINLVLIELL